MNLAGNSAAGPAGEAGQDGVRVMIVDDSAVIRGLTKRMLDADPDLSVVSSVGDGAQAVQAIKRQDVDVVVLDIEMPRMDGLTALPLLIEQKPGLQVIMSSTLTTRNADISLRALSMGAADYIPKPTSTKEIHGGEEFRRSLVEKVKALGAAARRGRREIEAPRPAEKPALKPATAGPSHSGAISLRPAGKIAPAALAIGSSTGGPQALFEFFKAMDPDYPLPIIITQHMPATFTKILADHIATIANRPCIEAQGGEVVGRGGIFVAPGGKHMLVAPRGREIVIKLSESPAENFCRPAVDPMLRSAVDAYGARLLTVILTGMGQDGLKGCEAVVAGGGTVIGQDEDSSVVWGMPGAVATNGLCAAVLPLTEIAGYVSNFSNRTAA